MKKHGVFLIMAMVTAMVQLILNGEEIPTTDWLTTQQWHLSGAIHGDVPSGIAFRQESPEGCAVLYTDPVPLDRISGRQFNAQILLHERSYAVIYLRVRLMKSPDDDSGRTLDGSGTYVSMPYDMRYPAGEPQWMRLRFEPQSDEKYLRLEIVAEKGACKCCAAPWNPGR